MSLWKAAMGWRRRAMPIIVISFNRGKLLERVIKSYLRQSWPIEIIIHDNGSDDKETIATLVALERAGMTVFRRAPIKNAEDLNLVDITVQEVFRNRTPGPYAVSDCDVDLSEADKDAFAVYLNLLRMHPDAQCVGPMLAIADISRSYPLFNRVMNIHVDHFWAKEPFWTDAAGYRVAYLPALIDTTFAVHRAGDPFHRLKHGIRVYAPFEARHLDWYLHDARDSEYHLKSAANISHWNNKHFLAEHAETKLVVNRYTVVEKIGSRYEAVRKTVFDNPD